TPSVSPIPTAWMRVYESGNRNRPKVPNPKAKNEPRKHKFASILTISHLSLLIPFKTFDTWQLELPITGGKCFQDPKTAHKATQHKDEGDIDKTVFFPDKSDQ